MTLGAPAMAAASGPDPIAVPGWDRIAASALIRVANAVSAEALRAPVASVRARVSDDGSGALMLEVDAPLAIAPLGSHRVPDEPAVVSAHRARARIAERFTAITGRQVCRVTVVFTASVEESVRRVR